MRFIIVAMLIVFLPGCTMDGGDVTSEYPNYRCTDTRDGEVFTFKASSITNARIGYGAPHSFDIVVNETGKKMHILDSMEVYLKCVGYANEQALAQD